MEYKNPRICFNNYELDDIENYCVFKETINPFQQYQELQRKDNIINNITKYVRTFKTNEITDRELCILNDILLIIEEKENIVAKLKEKQ